MDPTIFSTSAVPLLISARAGILGQQTTARSERASAADIFFDPNWYKYGNHTQY